MNDDPMYVAVAKLKLELALLWMNIGEDFKRWNPLRTFCYRKAARLYTEAMADINEWERFKLEVRNERA